MYLASDRGEPSHAGDPELRPPGLIFGIFPGLTGTEIGATATTAATYDPARTDDALARLQSPGRPFVIRGYAVYKGGGRVENRTPPDVERYLHGDRVLDYVLCYRPEVARPRRLDRVRPSGRARRSAIDPRRSRSPRSPTTPTPRPGGDGSSPDVLRALVEGVLATKDEAGRRGLPVAVGFNACPAFDPEQVFWRELARVGGTDLGRAVDYVGFDFFPDVFRPIPFEQLRPAVEGVLKRFRTVSLAAGGIPDSVPIRITENGWPTGPDRPPERQAEILETIVRTVHKLRGPLNITHYEFFSLRDGGGDIAGFREFGLVREDYTPKPAFQAYRRLIAELEA